MLPTSRKEAKKLGEKRYNDGKKCRNGHFSDRLTSTGQCCECKNEYQAKLREADPEALRAKEKAYYERHKEERLQYMHNHYHEVVKHDAERMERIRTQSREWMRENFEDQYAKTYHSRLNSVAKRRCHMKKDMGYSREITEIYKQCPEGHHVDHIVPLRGQYVCGLHVPWNLQYLTAEDNLKKGNRYDSEEY